MKPNIIQEKSFLIAIDTVKLYQQLVAEEKEYILSKQLLKSGTSIGANIEEAIGGYSKPDFLSKMTIAYKETREKVYWIKLLSATNILNSEKSNDLLSKAEEIGKIIGKILITSKSPNS